MLENHPHYSAGSFKTVWAVCAETINFLYRWAFFIGTKYIWFPQGPFYSNCAARYSRWSPTSYEEGCLRADVSYFLCCTRVVQIDDKTSSIKTVLFGVPQGSILGPFIFNLYVSDLQHHIKCSRYQYADDTTFFVPSKTKDLATDVVELNDAISRLGDYSSESNIALRWLNTVLRTVSGNSGDRAFLFRQTNMAAKKQWYTDDDFSKSTH